MSTSSLVVPGLWRVELGVVNAYLLRSADGLVLIDTGSPGSATDLLDAVAEVGGAASELSAVIVTHHHADHAGSLAAVLEATGAEAWMLPEDAAEVRAGNAFRPYRVASGVLNWVLERVVIRPTPDSYDPSHVAHEVSDGDALPGGLRAVAAPGHTAGHLALFWPEHGGVLIAGDACTNLPVLTLSVIYEDLDRGRQTLRDLARLDAEVAVFGHGKPIVGGASRRLRETFG